MRWRATPEPAGPIATRSYGPRWAKCGSGVGHGAYTLTISQIVALASRALDWRCEKNACNHRIPISLDQVEAVPFLIVRHMVKDHGMRPEEVVDQEPALGKEVEEYCRGMGVRG